LLGALTSARFPITWDQLIEKEALRFKALEHVGSDVAEYQRAMSVCGLIEHELPGALSYVDAPGWQGFFYERLCNSVGAVICPAFMRGSYGRWP
jgi:hypothetical protein